MAECCGMSVRSVERSDGLKFDLAQVKADEAPVLDVDLSGERPQCAGLVDGRFCQATTMPKNPVPYKFAAALCAVIEDEKGWYVLPANELLPVGDGYMLNSGRGVRFNLEGNRVQALCSFCPDLSS